MRFKYLMLMIGPILLAVGYWASVSIPERPVGKLQEAAQEPVDKDGSHLAKGTDTQRAKIDPDGEEGRYEEDGLIVYLEPSADPRDVLLLLVIRGHRNENYLSSLRELLAYTSERALVLYLIARLRVDGAYVATEAELLELQAIDPDNAEVDVLLAHRAYENGDTELALQHIQNAAGASGSKAYQAKYLAMLGDAYLRRNGYLTDKDFVSIIGYGAAYAMPNLSSFDRMCRENSEHPDWRAACGGRGEVLFEFGETVLERVIGAKFATDYLPGDIQHYADYREEIQETLVSLGTELEEIVTNSDLFIDRQTWEIYVEIYETEGEIPALRYLIDALSNA
ncbi:hypothetical protein QWI17_16770 [Gilvimarinus sp. SDUM040013]|uniref:Uncharacterized protein n=1 Tax=Gilvimarinus gilvus TaxID=3058038 RepID=A0ABU4S2H2_9GAMM|nr:hypothetical protein [Gilvimarinus sp. SDUM040013]MDO3387498.1 hypothetical protein [Gilvimarinus sp. SDUM040013]MDX6851356.1 hypothetical protein [Gilvimarinus sp. SDUM040013]